MKKIIEIKYSNDRREAIQVLYMNEKVIEGQRFPHSDFSHKGRELKVSEILLGGHLGLHKSFDGWAGDKIRPINDV